MHFLDFLSEPPKIFIFKKEKHKTNFGGILFLIYIIVMILISLVYIADYNNNEKYSYEALTIDNKARDKKNDKELNPILDISINFLDIDKFAIFEMSSMNLYEDLPKYDFSNQFTDNDIIIYYKCGEDPTWASFQEFINNLNYRWLIGYANISYQGYKIDHPHDPPVYEDNSGTFTNNLLLADSVGFINKTFNWEIFKYKDQKSLFDAVTKRKTEFNFGRIQNNNIPLRNYTKYDNYVEKIIKKYSYSKDVYFYYLPLIGLYFNNKNEEYLLYKRKKVSFLDVIANIGALFSTIKFFFSLALSFYSNNFNNYKIVGNLLNPPKKRVQSIINQNDGNNIPLNDLYNNAPLIDEQSNKNQIDKKRAIINDNDNENSNKDDKGTFSFPLKKLSFYDFFFNNIYSKCCKRMKNQEIINMTNNIMYKYLSIDSLLCNQIKIENLFKDYKWNNPSLNSVQNNIMLVNLKNI